jgi:hypothetical protein
LIQLGPSTARRVRRVVLLRHGSGRHFRSVGSISGLRNSTQALKRIGLSKWLWLICLQLGSLTDA